jgi:ABC-type transporter Mla maintaining outer membrane lipid asymmetry ATPase subunit MlaF
MAEATSRDTKSDAAAIELAGVDVTHYERASDTVLVRDVNWGIGFGEFWVVGGRQSSGKTSLLLTAAGLNRPAGGTLRILGCDLAAASEQDQIGWRRRMGFVFEHRGRLFSHLSVAQNIALPLQYHLDIDDSEVAARVDELLTLTDLQDYAQRTPSRLSLGVQQRVGLARALTSSVEVLFLDSPLTTLALREMRWWLDFLRRLQETRRAQGKLMTIVASADDFRGWLDVASHFAIVDGGRFSVVGGRRQVEAAAEPTLRDFLAKEI